MEIGEINRVIEVPKKEHERRTVVAIPMEVHGWLKAEARRRNVSLMRVTVEAFYCYRKMVTDSYAVEGEDE